MDQESILIAALISGTVLLGLVAIVGGFVHYRRERLLVHKERITALQLGRDLPDDAMTQRIRAAFGRDDSKEKVESLPQICFKTAGWVSFWAFLFASQASSNNLGLAIAIASAAGSIGMTALICGTILATRCQTPQHDVKHHVDADAYDFVSRRG